MGLCVGFCVIGELVGLEVGEPSVGASVILVGGVGPNETVGGGVSGTITGF